LGSSESIGRADELFSLIDKKWKIFRRKTTTSDPHPIIGYPSVSPSSSAIGMLPAPSARKSDELNVVQMVEAILKQSNTPPCVIIDEASDVVYIHGRTGKYLEPAQGRISANIIEMARPGLKQDLSTAI